MRITKCMTKFGKNGLKGEIQTLTIAQTVFFHSTYANCSVKIRQTCILKRVMFRKAIIDVL